MFRMLVIWLENLIEIKIMKCNLKKIFSMEVDEKFKDDPAY